MSAEHAPRTATGQRTCPICWTPFAPNQPRHTYCSDRCRKTAHKRRLTDNPPVQPPAPVRRQQPDTVAARACPHCGETITIVALLTTPQAARPVPPTTTDSVIPLRR